MISPVLFVASALTSVAVVFVNPILDTLDPVLPERCSSYWVSRDINALQERLQKDMFGQHLAVRMIAASLSSRWSSSGASASKPLVMSFHGWTGSGKNLMAQIIASSLFKEGMSSSNVHLLVATLHFPDPDPNLREVYRSQMRSWVRGNASLCQHSLFIFDEIDKMPVGVLDGIFPYMDFHEQVDGVDFRHVTFILLSNTGGKQITQETLKFWSQGKRREDITNADLEDLVSKGAFNEAGGLYHSDIIHRNLIDMFVPFLPLERHHVRQCVERDLVRRGLNVDKHAAIIQQVTDALEYWPPENGLFSSSGCKRVEQKLTELIFTNSVY